MNELSMTLPSLYKTKPNGKVQQWETWLELYNGKGEMISIENNELSEDYYTIIKSRYGYKGGKIQETGIVVKKGKNIGKKNETNVLTQGIHEMKSKWNNKVNKCQYTNEASGSKASESSSMQDTHITSIRPMLLHKYHEKKSKIKFPACVQPKLDGVRMITHYDPHDGKFRFFSRQGKEYYNLDHIEMSLQNIKFLKNNPSIYLDGEAFSNELSFNDIVGGIRKKLNSEIPEKLKFHIFDTFNTEDSFLSPFSERKKLLESLKLDKQENLVLVDTYHVQSDEEIINYHKTFVMTNEGTVVRNYDGLYTLDKRSFDVLKLKDFITEEFDIIGFSEGKGRDSGTLIYKLVTKDGKEFSARPEGTLEERKNLLKIKDKLLGEKVSVRFFEYTTDGAPRHPVALCVRNYE